MINRENSGQEWAQTFIRNINTAVKTYDYVIFSPSVGTGVSIDCDHFDTVFGFFRAGITDHQDLLQQLGRVRNPKSGTVHVWVEAKKLNHVTDPAKIKADIIENAKETGIITDFDGLGERIAASHE